MEFLNFFIFGLAMFGVGFLFYYPYYKKITKIPKLGIKKDKKLDYIGDGIKLLFYHRSIAVMFIGLIIIIFTIIMFVLEFFKN
jgi:hypothetical protein